ncbi:hypothetical protein D9756_010232 [Leucocoprinus leucothites]|uniref:DUF6533 domain-containing protein n=1 Tax=Leucocoprinus leucothites TaxID=201217 RepID=A0A8H5CUA6_9AGAR|nr:hypothetical protein D9756_010232 [Leucoagaricus leucothites]
MSSLFQHFIDKFILGRTVLVVTTYVNLASLTVLTYDWALNLGLEISLVWQSRTSMIKFLYLITRYLAFGDVTLWVYEQVAEGLTADNCAVLFSALGWMFTTGFVVGELLLVMRTWAVWGRDRRLGFVILAYYIGMVVAIYVNMGLFIKSVGFIDNVYHGVPGCIVVKASNKLYIDWVLLMVLDIAICALMIIKGCKSYVSGGNSQLMKVVYGEGIMYYVYLVSLSMINVVVILKLPPEYLALLSS